MATYAEHGPEFRIVPLEPMVFVPIEGLAINEDAIQCITIRAINDHGVIRFEAFSPADLKVATDWAKRHTGTTDEDFNWIPGA